MPANAMSSALKPASIRRAAAPAKSPSTSDMAEIWRSISPRHASTSAESAPNRSRINAYICRNISRHAMYLPCAILPVGGSIASPSILRASQSTMVPKSESATGAGLTIAEATSSRVSIPFRSSRSVTDVSMIVDAIMPSIAVGPCGSCIVFRSIESGSQLSMVSEKTGGRAALTRIFARRSRLAGGAA